MITHSEYQEVLQMRREFAVLRADWQRTLSDYYARKAGYKPSQPRWPRRSGIISGRWSGGAGSGSSNSGQAI